MFHDFQCGEIMCHGAFAAVTQILLFSLEAKCCNFKNLRFLGTCSWDSDKAAQVTLRETSGGTLAGEKDKTIILSILRPL